MSITLSDLIQICEHILGPAKTHQLFAEYAQNVHVNDITQIPPDPQLLTSVENWLESVAGKQTAQSMMSLAAMQQRVALQAGLTMMKQALEWRERMVFYQDRSDALERAQQELQTANERLASLETLKTDFMSAVTHELRTPLTSIRALAEIMHDDLHMAEDQRSNFLSIIMRETERLGRLVDQVLDLAKIEAGKADWRHTDIDVKELLSHATETVSAQCHKRGIDVHLDLPGEPVHIRGDADRLMQVMLNLLTNAMKFVPRDHGEICVRLQQSPISTTITVTDNGPGISEAQLPMIFEKFRQASDGTGLEKGTGLGLHISKEIAEHHGGRMWVESPPGSGAVFGFELPKTTEDPTQSG